MEFSGKWKSVKVENAPALFKAMVPVQAISDQLLAHLGSDDMTDEIEMVGDKMHRKTHLNGKQEPDATLTIGEEFDYKSPFGVIKMKLEKLAENKLKITEKGDYYAGCNVGVVDGDTLTWEYTVNGVTMTRTMKRQK